MTGYERIKLAFSLAGDLQQYDDAVQGYRALPKTTEALFGPGAQKLRTAQEIIKNRYMGMPPRPPGKIPNPGWGMLHDPMSASPRLFRGIDDVAAQERYLRPNLAGLKPGMYQVGQGARDAWLHSSGTFKHNFLGSQMRGQFPMLEQALSLAGMTGPSTGYANAVTGQGLDLNPALKSWRRKYMQVNPNFRSAFRLASRAITRR